MADKWKKANSRIYAYYERGMRESVRVRMDIAMDTAMWNRVYEYIWEAVETQEKDEVFRPMRGLGNE